MMKVALLLALLTVSEGSSVVGRAGGGVTLPCSYNISLHGARSVCWGRGTLPNMGCSGQLVSTDGLRVKEGTRISSRYELLGALDHGDVSLTIHNVSQTDAGRYGCRVDVPGWFNDDKHHFDLVVQDAPQTTTSSALPRETASAPPAASNATGHVTEGLMTSSSSGITAEVRGRNPEDDVNNGSSSVSLVLVWVLVGSGSLVIAAVLVIVLTRRRLSKRARHPILGSVQFRSSSSGLQLHSRESAVENIYQMDADGGEYEYCP